MLYSSVVEAAARIAAQVDAASHILVLTHVHPDGDAVGSLAAFGRVLRSRGLRVTTMAPTRLPKSAQALVDQPAIRIYTSERQLPQDCDLVVLLDTGSIDRLGPIFEEQSAYLAARPLLVIDHHVTNSGAGGLSLVVPEASATCELLYDLLRAWEAPIDQATATALLLGLLSDTQNFQTSSTTPHAMAVGAELVAAGGELEVLIDALYFRKPYANIQALGLALARLQREGALVWTELTQEMLLQTGADDEAADELTVLLARIDEAQVALLFKERPDGSVKVSFRSRPGVDVAAVAASLGGGGHRQASGVTLALPLAQARLVVLDALRQALAQD